MNVNHPPVAQNFRSASLLLVLVFVSGLSAEGLSEIIEGLKESIADRRALDAKGQQALAKLESFVEEHADSPARASDVGRARLLIAEVLTLQGDARGAARRLEEVIREGPLDEHRAQALYLRGQGLFLRERYVSQGRVRGAFDYWSRLRSSYPKSPWTRRVSRPLRFLEMLRQRRLPEFKESFAVGGMAQLYSPESLKGKLVVINFWSARTPGQREFEITMAQDMQKNFRDYPVLRAGVEFLWVNVDNNRALFEAALKEWKIPWPQYHQAGGFQSPLAVRFAIPRLPHLIVVRPGGEVQYCGGDRKEFFRILTRELVRQRKALEKEN